MTRVKSLPLYAQLPNCCGLSTFLMLLNPEQNDQYKLFLDELYEKIQNLMSQGRKEFRWSIALDYILLKTLGDNLIATYLKKQLKESFINYRAIMDFELKKTITRSFRGSFKLKNKQTYEFFSRNVICHNILRKSLYEMRTDMDLKILFTLFGGTFYPQKQENPDGTGALYFTRKDFEQGNYKNKLKIMEKHLKNPNNNFINCIALNMGFHWVAITNINTKRNYIQYNNPLGGRNSRRNIGKRISEGYRFYLFSHNPHDAFILKPATKLFLIGET